MAKKKKKVEVTLSDFGTPERKSQAGAIRFERVDKRLGGPKRMRVISQTPLDRYFQREQISRRQFEAGEKLYGLWRRAGRSQRLSSNYDAVIVDEGRATQTHAEAFSDYIAILRDLGRDMSKVAQWVCIEGMNANEAATKMQHDARGGITLLRLTLDALGDRFGMPRS